MCCRLKAAALQIRFFPNLPMLHIRREKYRSKKEFYQIIVIAVRK